MMAEPTTAEIRLVIGEVEQDPSQLLPVLWRLVDRYGWVSPAMMNVVSEVLQRPFAEIYGVASFYQLIPTAPVGPDSVGICMDVTCKMAGSQAVWDALGQTELKNSIHPVACLGHCENAPAAFIENRVVTHITQGSVLRVLGKEPPR
ncbi:hypothetical protein D2Q93_14855 [Alicyclobacillaceae bacterium I2511]|nr:hypothetical protein D2Q93_14855 [Alicyclobacillaceae bacterium I2511]